MSCRNIKFIPGVKADSRTRPRLTAEDYYAEAALTVQHVDYSNFNAPMYLNDQLGDCTCAGICHCWGAWTQYAGNAPEVIFADSVVETLYERFGYVPGDPSTDQGAELVDVLQSVHQEPVQGMTVDAYAELSDLSIAGLTTALKMYGPVYLGISCYQSMEDQFNAGQPFTWVPGSKFLGGHCVLLSGFMPGTNSARISTWGESGNAASQQWLEEVLANGGQAFAVYSKSFVNTAKGIAPNGINEAALLADMQSVPSL